MSANHKYKKKLAERYYKVMARSGGSRISQRRGRQAQRGGANLLFGQFFPKTACKWRNFGRGGGASLAPPLDPPLALHVFVILAKQHLQNIDCGETEEDTGVVGFNKFRPSGKIFLLLCLLKTKAIMHHGKRNLMIRTNVHQKVVHNQKELQADNGIHQQFEAKKWKFNLNFFNWLTVY